MRSFLCLLSLLTALVAHGEPSVVTIEVFSLSSLPITHRGNATVYDMDGFAQLEEALSTGLSDNVAQARTLAERRIREMGAQISSRSRNGGIGMARALQLSIRRVPAIVFAGQWVIYGISDVDEARKIFGAKRGSR